VVNLIGRPGVPLDMARAVLFWCQRFRIHRRNMLFVDGGVSAMMVGEKSVMPRYRDRRRCGRHPHGSRLYDVTTGARLVRKRPEHPRNPAAGCSTALRTSSAGASIPVKSILRPGTTITPMRSLKCVGPVSGS